MFSCTNEVPKSKTIHERGILVRSTSTGFYIDVAKYRQIAAEILRQIAAESRYSKQKPPLVEDFKPELFPTPTQSMEYG